MWLLFTLVPCWQRIFCVSPKSKWQNNGQSRKYENKDTIFGHGEPVASCSLQALNINGSTASTVPSAYILRISKAMYSRPTHTIICRSQTVCKIFSFSRHPYSDFLLLSLSIHLIVHFLEYLSVILLSADGKHKARLLLVRKSQGVLPFQMHLKNSLPINNAEYLMLFSHTVGDGQGNCNVHYSL